jgi:hypothetical protein
MEFEFGVALERADAECGSNGHCQEEDGGDG